MVVGSNPIAVTKPSDIAPVSSKEFLVIHVTIECGFTLKCIRDMIRTYSQEKVCSSSKTFINFKDSIGQK